jgi:putative transcriptional regulator
MSSAADRDNPPLTAADYARMGSVPRVRAIRRQLRLSPEEFASRYCIELTDLKDWETGIGAPSPTITAYLEVIAREPDVVRRALEAA